MANERPSDHPLGYWLAGTPASAPAHAWPQWLLDLLGPSLGGPPSAVPEEPQEQPTFPVPAYGPNGNVLANFGRPPQPQAMMRHPMNALRGFG